MKKILMVFVALLVVLVAAAGVAVATFDINKHRGQIESALSKQTGRTVKLGGDIHVGLSLKGLTLSIKAVAFGNPAWASRPNMANVGLFDLKVGLLPLLKHQVDINGLAIEDADILLESASGDRHNWDMTAANEKPAPAAKTQAAGRPVAIDIASLSIKNSRIALRGEDGKLTAFQADDLTLGREGAGLGAQFDGSFNAMPIKLAVTTSAESPMSKSARPIAVDLTFANYHLTAKGTIDLGGKKADLDSYELASGDTKIAGRLAADWGGARPAVQGTVTSDHLVPADLAMTGAEKETGTAAKPTAQATPKRMFSDQPLALGVLKSADVNLDLAIAALTAGSAEMKNVKGKLVINNGHVLLSPLNMGLGVGSINGQVNLDASGTPARLGLSFNVADVDLADLIKAGGAEAFLSGKVKANVNLSSSGNSPHELASNLNGPITLIGAGGDVISSASNKLSAGLAEILSPGTGGKEEGMNCLVARFIAQNGVVRGNGILVDTLAATAAGYGDIDLRSETLNLDFHAKTKLVNIGGLVPPLHIGGTLLKPETSFNPGAVVKNVGQMLMGGSATDGVPDVMTQQGQNACAYTLDHPSAAKPADKGGAVQDLAGKAGGLIKGLFGQ